MEQLTVFDTEVKDKILFILLLTNKAGCAKMGKEAKGKKGMVDR